MIDRHRRRREGRRGHADAATSTSAACPAAPRRRRCARSSRRRVARDGSSLPDPVAAHLRRGLPPPGGDASRTTPSTTRSPTCCPPGAPRACTAASCGTRRSPPSPARSTAFPGSKYPNLMLFYAVPTPGPHQRGGAGGHPRRDRALKSEPVTDDELRMVKTRAKANLVRGLDSNAGARGAARHLPGALRRLARAVPQRGPDRQGHQGGHPARGQARPSAPPTAPSGMIVNAGRRSEDDRWKPRRFRSSPLVGLRRRRRGCRRRRPACARPENWQEIRYPPLPALRHPQARGLHADERDGASSCWRTTSCRCRVDGAACGPARWYEPAEQGRPGRLMGDGAAQRRHRPDERRRDGRVPRALRAASVETGVGRRLRLRVA